MWEYYIIATVAGVLSVVFSGPILEKPLNLINVAANESQVLIPALFIFIMALAVAGIAIWAYPILKKHNEALALGFVGARIVEGALFIVGIISLLSLLTLSQEFVKAGAADASYFHTQGILLLAASDSASILGMVIFDLGALMFYYILYQTKLVPRWLSVWGIIGAPLMLVAVSFPIYVADPTPMISVLNAPIALQEMVLAVWLIVKGFDVSAIASESV
ncbi:DUF4386 domain-containing protein [Candidatus Neomarinimicrobiota bacterium]